MTRPRLTVAVAIAAVCGLLGSAAGANASAGVPASASSAANAAQATPLVWWALGDSYSSGEGIPGTEPKAKGAKKDCSRASGVNTGAKAWAVVAKEQLAEPRIKSWAFVPCTGAISSEVAGQIGEAQAASKVDKADIVTFSMGGNDILFPDVIKGCLDVELTWGSFVPGCDDDENTLRKRVDMLVGSRAPAAGQYVGETLPKLYDRVASNVRSGGAVVVLGYPQLIEEVGRWSGWRRNTLSVCKGILERDVPMLRSVAGYLNEQIALAVQAANKRWSAKGVRFFWRDIATGVYEKGDAPDQRHGLCSDTPWINGVTVGWRSGDAQHERSFHPKQEGHTDTGQWLARWMRSNLKLESMNKPKPPPGAALTGKQFGLVTSFNSARNALVVDIAQIVDGDALVQYYADRSDLWTELYCDSTGGFYDGTQALGECEVTGESQIVVNKDQRATTLAVSPSASFSIADGGTGAPIPASAAQFAAHLKAPTLGNTFDLVLDARGVVTKVEFHFFS